MRSKKYKTNNVDSIPKALDLPAARRSKIINFSIFHQFPPKQDSVYVELTCHGIFRQFLLF